MNDVSRTERELAQCLKRRRRIKSIQAAISRDQKQQVKFLTTKDAEMLTRFFPEADMRKLDEIEEFHRKLAKALKDEYRQAESSIQDDLDVIDTKIAELKSKLADLGKPTSILTRQACRAAFLAPRREDSSSPHAELRPPPWCWHPYPRKSASSPPMRRIAESRGIRPPESMRARVPASILAIDRSSSWCATPSNWRPLVPTCDLFPTQTNL